jgi:type I restriction-modification system DNA methylase subunit
LLASGILKKNISINLIIKKKLKNKMNNLNYKNYTNMTDLIDKSSNISNKEALKDKIHDIHNYLRNNGAGYGMNALKVFNIIYGLKKLEENNLIDKCNLKKPDCEFNYLLELANNNEDEKLAELIFGDVLTSISQSNIRELLFYEIPRNIKGSVLTYLIKEINNITLIEKTCNVLLSGKIYEYFVGRDENAISELGAYFTDRHIVEYIYKKLNPKKCRSMIDMFGGSGGFTTGYVNYLNTQNNNIDWETKINKIFHYDMNEDVIKSAGLELFCLTGVLPNIENLKYKNSFNDEFENKKFHYIITNPPYGGDSSKTTQNQYKRDKIKNYIKTLNNTEKYQEQLKNIEIQEKQDKKDCDKNKVTLKNCSIRIQKYAKKYNLKANDKESCSLILIMDLLDINGTAIGVLKEGVFFNSKYKDLRKCLIENFNIREIISVPSDQFENTSTKTSIIIFDNTENKTEEIIFRELIVNKYEEDIFEEINNEIYLIENKGDIKDLTDITVSNASVTELLENPIYSLNGKDYNKTKILINKDYELIKLEEISKIKFGTRITKNNNIDGKIPVYGGGDITFYTNISNRNKNTLIISRYALSKVCVRLITEDFYLNDSGLSLHSKDNNIQNYINYILLSELYQNNIYKNCISGSIQKNLNMNLFKNLEIPIPKDKSKIKEIVDKISIPYNELNSKKNRLKELETEIQDKIKNIIENEDCEEVKLGDICKIHTGKNLTKNNAINGDYNVYGGGISSYTHNEFNLEGFNIIISRVGNNNIQLINDKIYLTDNGFSLKITDKIFKQFIGYILLSNKDKILNISNGTAQKVISKSSLEKIKLNIPKNKQLITILEPIFEEIEQLKKDIKKNNLLYKQYIQELSEDAILSSN